MKIKAKKWLDKILYPKPEKVLGIDLGVDSLKMVQYDVKKNEITDYVIVELPTELKGTALTSNVEGMGDFLSDTINKHGFNAKDCVFTVGGRNAFVREIFMPPMSQEEMRQAVTWDSTQYVPFEADTYYVDFALCGEMNKGGQQPVLLVATPKAVIEALCAIGDRLELNILKIDVESLALYRTMEGRFSSFVMLELKRNDAVLSIFQHGTPVAQRSVQSGDMSFAQVIAEKTNVSISEALSVLYSENILGGNAAEDENLRQALQAEVINLARECRRTTDYYVMNKKDASFTDLVMVGSGSRIPGLQAALNEQLDLKVSAFDILQYVQFDSRFEKNKVNTNAPVLLVAIGATMAVNADD